VNIFVIVERCVGVFVWTHKKTLLDHLSSGGQAIALGRGVLTSSPDEAPEGRWRRSTSWWGRGATFGGTARKNNLGTIRNDFSREDGSYWNSRGRKE